MNLILYALLASLVINVAMFVPAYFYKTDKLTDISYALSFISIALFAYIQSSQSFVHLLALGLVTLWGTRLGVFLLYRIHKISKDNRFNEMRGNFWKFLQFWLLQGLTVFAVLLSTLLLWRETNPVINGLAVGGVVIFFAGWLIETIADAQKFRFNKLKTKDLWIDDGIWRVSRHPNYLGEILVWLGLYVFALPSLSIALGIAAAISPLFIICLLLFVSGIPIVENIANKKWSKQPGYQTYKKAVPVLIPTLSSLKRLDPRN